MTQHLMTDRQVRSRLVRTLYRLYDGRITVGQDRGVTTRGGVLVTP